MLPAVFKRWYFTMNLPLLHFYISNRQTNQQRIYFLLIAIYYNFEKKIDCLNPLRILLQFFRRPNFNEKRLFIFSFYQTFFSFHFL